MIHELGKIIPLLPEVHLYTTGPKSLPKAKNDCACTQWVKNAFSWAWMIPGSAQRIKSTCVRSVLYNQSRPLVPFCSSRHSASVTGTVLQNFDLVTPSGHKLVCAIMISCTAYKCIARAYMNTTIYTCYEISAKSSSIISRQVEIVCTVFGVILWH